MMEKESLARTPAGSSASPPNDGASGAGKAGTAVAEPAGALTRELLLGGNVTDLIAAGKAELKALRQRAIERTGRLPGQQVARQMSDELDGLLRAVYMFYRLKARAEGRPVAGRDHVLMAVGGNGRAQMSIYSDVDLQFLVPREMSEGLSQLIGDFYKTLWDIGMELGSVVRSRQECLNFIGRDIKSVTALLDARPLAGSPSLNDELLQEFHRRLSPNGPGHRWYLGALDEHERRRHETHGGSEYVLEPDLKEGKGALRDHHHLKWYLFAQSGMRTLRQLHDARVIPSADLQRLKDNYDFLMTLRGHLHRLAGRKTDVLAFEYHRPLAQAMRFRESDGHLAEELMMREYYIKAHRTRFIVERIKRELSDDPKPTLVGRMVGRFQERRVAPYFVIRRGKLYIDERRLEAWSQDPDGIMLCFVKLVQLGVPLAGQTIERLQAQIGQADAELFRTHEYNRDAFLKVIGHPTRGVEGIRTMHECDVLERYIPEFEHLYCLVRADHYHRYTVDEHTFKTLEAAEALLSDDPTKNHLARVARRIERWPVFMLGLLLHDIGKGKGHGHVLRGGTMTGAICDRMGLPLEDKEFTHFLVTQHLKMSHLALRRDLTDPRVAEELASVVESRDRLDALYVLTYCDITGVGPGNWNTWKEQLLRELYEKTAAILERGEYREEEILIVPSDLKQRVQEQLGGDATPRELDRFLEQLPARYLHYTPPEYIASHFRLMKRRTAEEPVTWELMHNPRLDRSLLVVCGPDLPGLFHLLTRALASKRLSITSASCMGVSDGMVIDQFSLTYNGRNLPPDFRLERLREKVCEVLLDKTSLEEAFGPPARLESPDEERERLVPTQVKVDNEASDQWTVCEIKTFDRPGLLSVVSGVFNEARLYIHQALITTEAYRVVDVFYLSTLDNNKLTDRAKIRRLESRLLEELGPRPKAEDAKEPPAAKCT